MLYTFYQQTPLPAPLGRNDEILPLFIIHSLRNGAAGFIVAAIVAAALSPSINAMAATTVNDFYVKYIRPDADDATLLRVSKIATVFWGVVQIGVALGAQTMERSVLDAGLVGAVAGLRIGARRVHHRHADAARRLAGDAVAACSRGWRRCSRSGCGRRSRGPGTSFIGASMTVGVASRWRRLSSPVARPRRRHERETARSRSGIRTHEFRRRPPDLRDAIARQTFPAAVVEVGHAHGPVWREALRSSHLRSGSRGLHARPRSSTSPRSPR